METLELMVGYSYWKPKTNNYRLFVDLPAKLQNQELYKFEQEINSSKNYRPKNKTEEDLIVAKAQIITSLEDVYLITENQLKLAQQAVIRYREVPIEKRIEIINDFTNIITTDDIDYWMELTVQEGYNEITRASSLDSIIQGISEENITRKVSHMSPYVLDNGDRTEQVSYGVIGFSVPSNAAFAMQTQFILESCILAGNAAIIKPSSRGILFKFRGNRYLIKIIKNSEKFALGGGHSNEGVLLSRYELFRAKANSSGDKHLARSNQK